MKYLVDFLTAKNVRIEKIFPHLNLEIDEAELLRSAVRRYVEGIEESGVLELLQERFGEAYKSYLRRVSLMRKIIDLGWLLPVRLGESRVHEISRLELLNSAVTPSPSLLRLLEEGTLELSLPEIKPYTDHLEYLQDQFDLVELMHKIATHRQSFSGDSLGVHRLGNRLKLLRQRIEERIQVTDEPIIVEEFFREKGLAEKERRIFLALLREEYGGGEGQLREMNSLIELVSFDEYEKIKNRALLEEGSRLISEGIVDYEEIITMFGGISRSFYLREEVMQRIIHPNKKTKVEKLKLDRLVKEQDLFEYLEPDRSLEDLVLHPETRAVLDRVVRQMDREVHAKLKAWGIKERRKGIAARLIFYVPPGTGKTVTALGLARTLKRPILGFDCSKILSMYVGESEKNVRRIFDDFKSLSAKAGVEPVLLLNEADQFLSARSGGAGGSADKMHNQMQNIFLEQIERFDGILIATTNLLENIDKAFSRRFNFKIEFKRPDRSQRLRLWQPMLPEKADYEEGFDIATLAGDDLSGGQIELVIRNTAYRVALREESIFTMEDFTEEIEKELHSTFDRSREMGFKVS